jgi:hypothetical protein
MVPAWLSFTLVVMTIVAIAALVIAIIALVRGNHERHETFQRAQVGTIELDSETAPAVRVSVNPRADTSTGLLVLQPPEGTLQAPNPVVQFETGGLRHSDGKFEEYTRLDCSDILIATPPAGRVLQIRFNVPLSIIPKFGTYTAAIASFGSSVNTQDLTFGAMDEPNLIISPVASDMVQITLTFNFPNTISTLTVLRANFGIKLTYVYRP